MKQSIWSKTILLAYRYLERIANSIDNLVIKEALGSLSWNMAIYSMKSADKISAKIIDLSEKKVALINTKVLIEKALYSMKKEQAIILIKRYLEGKKPHEVAQELGYPRRTYYRKLDAAVNTFYHKLVMFGYDEVRLEKMLGDQKWIKKIYDSVIAEDVEVVVEIQGKFSTEQDNFLQNVYRANKVSLFC